MRCMDEFGDGSINVDCCSNVFRLRNVILMLLCQSCLNYPTASPAMCGTGDALCEANNSH